MSDSADRPTESSVEHLLRLFTVPEAADSTLARIEQELSANLADFLGEHVVATARSLAEIEADFADTRLTEAPTFVSDQADFLHKAAPGFVGQMTTALPCFMLPLTKLLTGHNQNPVKTETSKVFTPRSARCSLRPGRRLLLGTPARSGSRPGRLRLGRHSRQPDCALGRAQPRLPGHR